MVGSRNNNKKDTNDDDNDNLDLDELLKRKLESDEELNMKETKKDK